MLSRNIILKDEVFIIISSDSGIRLVYTLAQQYPSGPSQCNKARKTKSYKAGKDATELCCYSESAAYTKHAIPFTFLLF